MAVMLRRRDNFGMAELVRSRLKRRRPIFLREWRKYRGLTQEQLAERTGYSPGNISHLENGKQNYTQEALELLADALQCEPADLLMRNPTDTEAPWSIWETLKPAERRQAIEVIRALKRASGE